MITPKEVLSHVLPPDMLNPSAWTLPPSDTPDLDGEGTARIAVVGQSGVGKKTLCNTLWGWDAISAAPCSQPTQPPETRNYSYESSGS